MLFPNLLMDNIARFPKPAMGQPIPASNRMTTRRTSLRLPGTDPTFAFPPCYRMRLLQLRIWGSQSLPFSARQRNRSIRAWRFP